MLIGDVAMEKKRILVVFCFFCIIASHVSSQESQEIWTLNPKKSAFYFTRENQISPPPDIYNSMQGVLVLNQNGKYLLRIFNPQIKKILKENKGEYKIDKRQKKLILTCHRSGGIVQDDTTETIKGTITPNGITIFLPNKQKNIPPLLLCFEKVSEEKIAARKKIKNIRMKIESAEINLLKKDGNGWDFGMDSNTKKQINAAIDITSMIIPQANYVQLLTLIPSESRPDAFVIVRVLHNGAEILQVKTPKYQDEYCPIYNYDFEFTINDDARNYEIEISLFDQDLKDHDAIGTKTLSLEDFLNQEENIIEPFDSVRKIKIRCNHN